MESFDIWDQTHNGLTVNYTKLQSYIEVNLHFRLRKSIQNVDKEIIKSYRNCRLDDFTKRDYQPDSSILQSLPGYLCPDIADDYDNYLIEEKYTNLTLRKSFSVQVLICDKDRTSTCQGEAEIDRFLNTFYFTFYTL